MYVQTHIYKEGNVIDFGVMNVALKLKLFKSFLNNKQSVWSTGSSLLRFINRSSHNRPVWTIDVLLLIENLNEKGVFQRFLGNITFHESYLWCVTVWRTDPKIYTVIKAMPVPLKRLEKICCTVPSLSKLSIQYIDFSDWKISKFIRMTLVKDFFPLIRLKGIISLKIWNWFRTPKLNFFYF